MGDNMKVTLRSAFNGVFNKVLTGLGVSSVLLFSANGFAEGMNYSCSYTQASYTAPFMKQPNIRNCPEGRCSYQVQINGSMGTVNGVSGFGVDQSNSTIKLSRTAKDPVMGGMDTTVLTINKSDMTFTNVKTTTPSVTLTTQGTCN